MEAKNGNDNHHVSTTTTTTSSAQVTGSNPLPASIPPPPSISAELVGSSAIPMKKRGRPRKYGPDGSVAVVLSPKPISFIAPSLPVLDCSVGVKEPRGDILPSSVRADSTLNFIHVNAGEDITMKVISFSQQGPRAICILSATGAISRVTLHQNDSSGKTVTYEGRFEILTLSGSYMPSQRGGMRNVTGSMSVSLACPPDGRVVGGRIAGLLVAAEPVHIVVGRFQADN